MSFLQQQALCLLLLNANDLLSALHYSYHITQHFVFSVTITLDTTVTVRRFMPLLQWKEGLGLECIETIFKLTNKCSSNLEGVASTSMISALRFLYGSGCGVRHSEL